MNTQSGAVLNWLLEGDVAIRYQACRDLMGIEDTDLQRRIAKEGWGRRLLDCRKPDGGWGKAFYQPKWTSTHYTLLELKGLHVAPETPGLRDTIFEVLDGNMARDGGVGTSPDLKTSDVCVNGMFLTYACYFKTPEAPLKSIIDFLLTEKMSDGGFNCRSNRSGARHSSLHSTLSVLEGLLEYQRAGHRHRLDEVKASARSSRDFVLQHRFFKSDRTGQIIHPDFLKMPYPPRWRYNILRALDHFRGAGDAYDPRMADALTAITGKRRADGKWPRQAALPGTVHFVMELARGPSRWNTLIALRVLKTYAPGSIQDVAF